MSNNRKVLKGSNKKKKMITYYKRPDEHVEESEETLDADVLEDVLEAPEEE